MRYSEPQEPTHGFNVPCSYFVSNAMVSRDAWRQERVDLLDISNRHFYFYPKGWTGSRSWRIERGSVPVRAVYAGLRKSCEAGAPVVAETEERLRTEAIENERLRQASAFRRGVLEAVNAAEAPDPFASIRGEFDLAGSGRPHWNTSLQLPNADKCVLIKFPSSGPLEHRPGPSNAYSARRIGVIKTW